MTLRSLTREAFLNDAMLRAAAERHFQVAIQASLDIGSMLLADEPHPPPTTYRAIFPALARMGILPDALADRLGEMAAFRNVLVHLYLEVSPDLLYVYLQEGLTDLESYARHVAEYLDRRDTERSTGGAPLVDSR